MREKLNYIVVGVITALIVYFVSPSILSTRVEIVEGESYEVKTSSTPLSYSNAFNKVKESVVTIYTQVNLPQRSNTLIYDAETGQLLRIPPKRAQGQGSGVIVTGSGHVVTNYHVIKSATAATVVDFDGKNYVAELVGIDPETDLAVLKIDASLKPITFGKITSIQIGDVVLAIGNPLGVGQSVTMGIISATGRDRVGLNTYERFIQTDAAINSGNSGGALVNTKGEMIGINTAISTSKKSGGGSDGIGWAIPTDIVKNVLTQIIEKGEVTRGFLGLTAVPEFNGRGVLIESIYKNGPADIAGIRIGDIVRKINDVEVYDIKDIQNMVANFLPEQTVILQVQRKEKVLKFSLVVSKRPIK